MSYILDALQRAEAERERGHVPGLHSPTGLPGGHPVPDAPPLQPTVGRWLAVAAVVLALVAGGWWLARPAVAPPAGPLLAKPDAPGKVAAAPAPPSDAAPATAGTAPAAAPPEAAPALPILAPPAPPREASARARPSTSAASAASAATTPASTSAATATAAPAAASSAQTTATPSTPAAPDRAAAAPNADKPVRSWAELPAETRAQLPPVSVSGSTYSKNPAHRMLIVNGQVVQEGQPMAPGLVLESIGPRSAVLNHRGLRYSITY